MHIDEDNLRQTSIGSVPGSWRRARSPYACRSWQGRFWRTFRCSPEVRSNHLIYCGGWYGYDYSRLADCYPGAPNDRWRGLGRRRFVESKKTDSNFTEKLGYSDCNNLWRLWHAWYCPGLTPIAQSGSSGLGGSLEAVSKLVSGVQLVEQGLGFLQIERVEPLREPPVNLGQQFARLLHLALVAPEASEAHCGAEFPGFGLLLARDCESALEKGLRFSCIPFRRVKRYFSGHAEYLGFPQPVLVLLHCRHRFTNTSASISELAEFRIGPGKKQYGPRVPKLLILLTETRWLRR